MSLYKVDNPLFLQNRQSYLMLLLLNILSILGNYWQLPLFFGIDFTFSSIAVLLTIHLFGMGWGMVSALIACSYPWWIGESLVGPLCLVLEALFIGLTWRRFSYYLLLLDSVFWLGLGVPLLRIVYLYLFPLDTVPTLLLLLKISFNGITNAAIASVLIMLLPLARWAKRPSAFYYPSLHQILLNLIATFVLVPALIILALNSWQLSYHTFQDLKIDAQTLSENLTVELQLLHHQHLRALEEIATVVTLSQLKPVAEWEQQTNFILDFFPELIEITITNTQGTILFSSPQTAAPIHTQVHDQFQLEQIVATPNPLVFNNYFSENQTVTPLLTYTVPILQYGQITGVVFAYLDFKMLAAFYKSKIAQANAHQVQFTLTDLQQRVLHSTRRDLARLSPYIQSLTTKQTSLANGNNETIYLTFPANHFHHLMLRWLNSTYVQQTLVDSTLPLLLMVEIPLYDYVSTLFQLYINKMIVITIITIISLMIASIISHWLRSTLLKLTQLTDNLPNRLQQPQSIHWPQTHISEIAALTHNFKSMAESLQARFEEIQTAHNRLEQRVQVRTQELQRERALLRNLIDSLPDLVFYKDNNSVYLGCNRAFEEFAGCPDTELIGQTDFKLFSLEMAEFFYQQDQKIFTTGQTQKTEEWVNYPNGQRVLLDIIRTPFLTLNGEILGLIGTSRDITARQQVEEQLRYSQQMLRFVIDNIPQYIFWKDQQAIYLGCNQNFARVIGLYSPEEIVGKTDNELIQLVQADTAFFDLLSRCIIADGHSEYHYIEALPQPGGPPLWLELNKIPLRDAAGQVIGVLGSVENITERKRAEEKLRQAAKVLENSAEAITITNAQTQIISVNKAFTQITGYSEAEILGQRTTILKSGKHSLEFYQKMWKSISTIGYWEGEIWNRRKNGEIYQEWLHISVIKDENTTEITNYLAIFSDITERKQTEQRLAYLAHYDDLTGLPNRNLFYEKATLALTHAQPQNQPVAIIFLDLDRFKYINDTWGHLVGDLLLKDVTRRLTNCLSKTDTIARLGGDDFTLLLENLNNHQAIETVAKGIIAALQIPFELNGHEVFITASLGLSIYPIDGVDVDTLLKHADAAMYRAKEAGRNNYQFYKPQMNILTHHRLSLESKLRHALERDELLLYYQPQMHLGTGLIVGAEILLRWQHPELGLVLPYTFIPLAEETGLIIPIGEWVLRHTCLQHQRWRDTGKPILRMAVNLSSRQFRQENLTPSIMRIVEETNIDPTLLELELTESMLMQDVDAAAKVLHELKDRGIQLAIDDFGTGYSSLSYLKRFPIDKLKIDQSFIRDIPANQDDMMITKAIVALARSLNLKVIAEGVETKPQEAFLRTLKCDEIQGYLIGHPMPADEFINKLIKIN